MAKKFYNPITDAIVHHVATLLAAGVRPYTITNVTGASSRAIRAMELRGDWADILAGKRAGLARLIRGDA